jgi:ABC-2 type transport system permease protein
VWRRVMRHEWRHLVADRTAVIVFTAFALTIGYALLNGATQVRRQESGARRFLAAQEANTLRLQERARAMESYLAAGGTVENLPRYERYEHDFGPLDARYAAAHNPLSAVSPPPPLAALTVGLSDLYPAAHTVSWWDTETVSAAEPTESPLKLLTGSFDLAFVMLYLFPLFILALCFNLIAAEKEGGTLGMLLAQPITLRTLLAGKVLARAPLIFVPVVFFTAAGTLLSGIEVGMAATAWRLLGWAAVVALYGAFWFGLAVLVNGLGRTAATNAMTLLVCWLAFVVLLPTAVTLLATTLHPAPSRAEFVNAKRELPFEVEGMDEGLLREQFFRDHPEFSRDWQYTDWGLYGIANVAKEEEVERRLQATRRRFDEQLSRQEGVVNALGHLSPAILAQRALYDFAGAGADRRRHYLSQAKAYNREWKAHFWPAMFKGTPFSAADYDRLPRFEYREEPAGVAARRAFGPLLTLFVFASVSGALGVRAYRRYPVVG